MRLIKIMVLTVLTGCFLCSNLYATSTASELHEATFVVGCYDVGKTALDGQPGILKVEKGWRNFQEINRVVYDPTTITLKDIEAILKESGTYKQTIIQKE